MPGTGAEFRLRLRQGLLGLGRGVGACVGALGVGQGVPRRGQRLHGHMGGGGQGRDCWGGGHRRGGVRLPAAENRLPHQQQSQPQAEPAVFHRGGPAVPAEEILLNLLMEALTLVLDPEYSPLPVQSQGDLDGLSLGGEAQGIG